MTARLARAWRWIKAGILALATLAAALLGIRLVRELRVRLGPVSGMGGLWMPNGESQILVTPSGGGFPVPVTLPQGITSREVRAVELGQPGEVVVELLHKPRDRRGMIGGKP